MSEAYLSPAWYRVAPLKLRLRAHLRVFRHRYRGEPWYVLEDRTTGRSHRFTPAAYAFLGRLDGEATVNAIWEGLTDDLGEDAPSQEAIVQLLGQLHSADLLHSRTPADLGELMERRARQSAQIWKQNFKNPLSFRVPLFDPDRLLRALVPWLGWLVGPLGLLLWAGLVSYGGVLAAQHWPALTGNVADRLLAAENLAIMAVTYPLLKGLHELGHGLVLRRYGAEVHEMGVMFLVFFPVPYVDASGAATFRSKWRRAGVAAAGIVVETACAAGAMIAWTMVEPGLTRAVLFNVMVLGGVSTVLVNGNPLLRFDGYYILADLLEIPNLATRASRFWGHWTTRYLLGGERMRDFHASRGERIWFALYAPAAFIYRLFIMTSIALFVIAEYFVVGVVLALWAIYGSLVKPTAKALWHVVSDNRLRRRRGRAMTVTFGGIAAVLAALMLVPAPLSTVNQGVVWLPEGAALRAGTDGFVAEVLARPGAAVEAGAPLIALTEPMLAARIAVLEAERRALGVELAAAEVSDPVQAALTRIRIEEAEARLARERTREAGLVLTAPIAGRFQPSAPVEDLVGRFLRDGETVGHVLPEGPQVARVVIPQDDADLLRRRLRSAELRLADRPETPVPVTLLRAVPGGTDRLPSAALSQAMGGPFPTDPTDGEGLRTLERVFQLDFALPEALEAPPFGSLVHLKARHAWEPLGLQLYRRARQLVMARLDA